MKRLFSCATDCTTSECCRKFEITVDRAEYEALKPEIKKHFVKKSDVLTNFEREKRLQFAEMIDRESGKQYAAIKKTKGEHCVFIDKGTMLCTIYNNRPSPCAAYDVQRCDLIKVLNVTN